MTHRPGESTASWYERAIVADSLAAAELEAMTDSPVLYNHHAQAAIHKGAVLARDDLEAACNTYTRERRLLSNPAE